MRSKSSNPGTPEVVVVEPFAQTPLAVACAEAATRGDDADGPPPEGYRRNVSVLLVSPRTRRAFVATRVDDPHATWQCPQGGVDPGESALAAALRELEEETAVTSVRVVGALRGWRAYDFPDWVKARLGKRMSRYKGQAQRWFLVLYTGDPGVAGQDPEQVLAQGIEEGEGEEEGCAEADLSGGGKHSREFSSWAWRPLERLPLDVSEFKRGVYAAAAGEFGAVLDELEAGGALRRVADEATAEAVAKSGEKVAAAATATARRRGE